jgi:hypothetical protein
VRVVTGALAAAGPLAGACDALVRVATGVDAN